MKIVYQTNIDQPTQELTEQVLREITDSASANTLIANYRRLKRLLAEAEEKGTVEDFTLKVTEEQGYRDWLSQEMKKDERRSKKRIPEDSVKRVKLYISTMKSSLPAVIPTATFTESTDRWGRRGLWRVQDHGFLTGFCVLDADHVPNPEEPGAMRSICEAVLENHADLGVIFDTDVDRGGAVDRYGKEINRNRLVALSSCLALEGNEGGTVVTDSITSPGVREYIEDYLGGHHYRYRRGYRNIINKAIDLNRQGVNCPIASETSGHVAMRENYFLDDGAYLCTKMIVKMAQLARKGETRDSLGASLKEPVEAIEMRFKITEHDFKSAGQKVIDNLTAYAEADPDWIVAGDNREGIRVSFDKDHGDGWFLLRLSVHDPILPLNIESDSEGGVAVIREKVLAFLRTQDGIEV